VNSAKWRTFSTWKCKKNYAEGHWEWDCTSHAHPSAPAAPRHSRLRRSTCPPLHNTIRGSTYDDSRCIFTTQCGRPCATVCLCNSVCPSDLCMVPKWLNELKWCLVAPFERPCHLLVRPLITARAFTPLFTALDLTERGRGKCTQKCLSVAWKIATGLNSTERRADSLRYDTIR